MKDFPFVASVVLSLALGIGLNTAIFTFLNAVFLRPFPVRDAERLASMVSTDQDDPRFLPNSYPNFLDIRNQNTVFLAMAAFQAIEISVAEGDRPERAIGQMVTGNFFDVLGVKMQLGRGFLPDEDATPGSHPVVVLSYSLWKNRFSGDTSIIGKSVLLNGRRFTVVGVTAKGFKGTGKRTAFQLWVPLMMNEAVFSMPEHIHDRDWRLFRVVGRLKPGVTFAAAKAELKAIAQRLELEHPEQNHGQSATLVPFMHEALGPNDRYLFVRAGLFLTIVVSLVLLGACANVANLLLARSSARRQEIATRVSLGASRGRLIQQLLTESILLSLVAGALGLFVASISRSILTSFKNPFFSSEALDAPLDIRVLGYALAVSIVAGIIFGLAPALQTSSTSPLAAMKGIALNSGVRKMSLRSSILAAQVSLSFISLVMAGWFLRSLYNARQTDPGFQADNLILVTFNVSSLAFNEKEGRQFADTLLREAVSVPGVQNVSLAENRLLAGIVMARSVAIEGTTSNRPEPLTPTNSVSPRYFETLGIPIVSGRAFTLDDNLSRPKVAIINEAMARKYWPNDDPIGRRFHFEEALDPVEVIGIAKDSRFISLTQNPQPHIYLPLLQNYSPSMTLYVRALSQSPSIVESVRSRVQSSKPQLPIDLTTARDLIDHSLWAPRMAASLLTLFGLLTLCLAAMGVYSIAAFNVSQRRTEIGLRMALGARKRDIFRLVLGGGITLIGIGVLLGTAIIVLLGRLASGLLFNVSPLDLATLGMAAAILMLIGVLAHFFPARQAAGIDPISAIQNR